MPHPIHDTPQDEIYRLRCRVKELETVLQQAYDFVTSIEPQGHIGLRHSDMRSKILDVQGSAEKLPAARCPDCLGAGTRGNQPATGTIRYCATCGGSGEIT